MENFVLLKDSYDSLAFDSYDLIPTLGDPKNRVSIKSRKEKRMSDTWNIFSMIKNSSKFAYFYFYNGVFRNLGRLVSFKNNIKILAVECYF